MKNKSYIILMLIAFSLALTSAVFADDLYTFSISEGVSRHDDAEHWYLDLNAPEISGMSDNEEEAELNEYFQQYADYIAESYEEDKAYFLDNFEEEEDGPHFGYEYFWHVVTDSDDYFVFDTQLFYAAGSSMTVNEYWTLDKHTGKLVELSDLADEEQLTGIRDMIFETMKTENEAGSAFWTDDKEIFDQTFAFVEEYRHWYVNEAGNLVITFDKYEIAPGAFGASEFEVVDGQVRLIKDEKYSFDLFVGDELTEKEKNWSMDLKVPAVSGMADHDEQDTLNHHFKDKVESIKSEYEAMAASAEEPAAEGDGPFFSFEYGYEILTDNDDVFVFKSTFFFAGASSMTSNEFWNLDKNTGKLISFEEVVPAEALPAIHDKIFAEMKAANDSGDGYFFLEDENLLEYAWENIVPFNHWYLNADGDLVIAFDKYEVAAGAQGTPEFVIGRDVLTPAAE